MGDIAVENYQKSVTKILDIWAKEADRIGKELAAANAELDKLEALQNPSPDDKKRIEELKKKTRNLLQAHERSFHGVAGQPHGDPGAAHGRRR